MAILKLSVKERKSSCEESEKFVLYRAFLQLLDWQMWESRNVRIVPKNDFARLRVKTESRHCPLALR